MSTLHVTVTAEDIAEGAVADGKCCPIALAIRRVRPDLIGPGYVFSFAFSPTGGIDGDNNVPLPQAARRFIERLGGSEPVDPFEFDLEVPA